MKGNMNPNDSASTKRGEPSGTSQHVRRDRRSAAATTDAEPTRTSTSPIVSPDVEASPTFSGRGRAAAIRKRNDAMRAGMLERRAPTGAAVSAHSSARRIRRFGQAPTTLQSSSETIPSTVPQTKPRSLWSSQTEETETPPSPPLPRRQHPVVIRVPNRRERKAETPVVQDRIVRKLMPTPRQRQWEMKEQASKEPTSTSKIQQEGSAGRGRAQRRYPLSHIPIRSARTERAAVEQDREEKIKFAVPSRSPIASLRQRLLEAHETASPQARQISEIQQKIQECNLGGRKNYPSRSLTTSSPGQPSEQARDITLTLATRISAVIQQQFDICNKEGVGIKAEAAAEATASTSGGKKLISVEEGKSKPSRRRIVQLRHPLDDPQRSYQAGRPLRAKTPSAPIQQKIAASAGTSFKNVVHGEQPSSSRSMHHQREQPVAAEGDSVKTPKDERVLQKSKKIKPQHWGLETIHESNEAASYEEAEMSDMKLKRLILTSADGKSNIEDKEGVRKLKAESVRNFRPEPKKLPVSMLMKKLEQAIDEVEKDKKKEEDEKEE